MDDKRNNEANKYEKRAAYLVSIITIVTIITIAYITVKFSNTVAYKRRMGLLLAKIEKRTLVFLL